MFSDKLLLQAAEAERELAPVFARIDEIAFKNTEKVLSVFRENRLSDRHFNSTCGYGYNDDGRDLCDKMFADAFGCEAGFARSQIISGTHALAIALYGVLRPGLFIHRHTLQIVLCGSCNGIGQFLTIG